jgi:hypothetical protein
MSDVSYNGPQENTKRLLNDTVTMMQLVSYVQEHLSPAIQAWKDFSNPDGDVNQFSDLCDHHSRVALKSIKTSFREMVKLEQNLVSLIRRCKNSEKTVRIPEQYEAFVVPKLPPSAGEETVSKKGSGSSFRQSQTRQLDADIDADSARIQRDSKELQRDKVQRAEEIGDLREQLEAAKEERKVLRKPKVRLKFLVTYV